MNTKIRSQVYPYPANFPLQRKAPGPISEVHWINGTVPALVPPIIVPLQRKARGAVSELHWIYKVVTSPIPPIIVPLERKARGAISKVHWMYGTVPPLINILYSCRMCTPFCLLVFVSYQSKASSQHRLCTTPSVNRSLCRTSPQPPPNTLDGVGRRLWTGTTQRPMDGRGCACDSCTTSKSGDRSDGVAQHIHPCCTNGGWRLIATAPRARGSSDAPQPQCLLAKFSQCKALLQIL